MPGHPIEDEVPVGRDRVEARLGLRRSADGAGQALGQERAATVEAVEVGVE
jgi:hypothetical protein